MQNPIRKRLIRKVEGAIDQFPRGGKEVNLGDGGSDSFYRSPNLLEVNRTRHLNLGKWVRHIMVHQAISPAGGQNFVTFREDLDFPEDREKKPVTIRSFESPLSELDMRKLAVLAFDLQTTAKKITKI